MTQALPKIVTFEEFVKWKPENERYELHNGIIIKMSQPVGDHEEVTIVDYAALGGREFIGKPKQPTILIGSLDEGEYQISKFRSTERIKSRTFPELNLTAEQIFQAGNISA